MPRYDGNTRSRRARHHKAMNSAARGKGHSAKARLAKRHGKDNFQNGGYGPQPDKKSS